jgi:hypothetical protein
MPEAAYASLYVRPAAHHCHTVGFVMDAGADGTRPEIDISALVVGKRYRVDWRHEGLRRSFRATGTLLSIEATPATTPDGESARWLRLEVKPRFGQATVQRVDVATLRSVEPF